MLLTNDVTDASDASSSAHRRVWRPVEYDGPGAGMRLNAADDVPTDSAEKPWAGRVIRENGNGASAYGR